MAQNGKGIEENIEEHGDVVELDESTTDREGVFRALMSAILGALHDGVSEHSTMTADIHVRKATPDKPRRVIVHANHADMKRKSTIAFLGKRLTKGKA